MPVYLLHSTVPLTRENGSRVYHYLGYCEEGGLAHRVAQHASGRKSTPIVRAFLEHGGVILLGNYWPGLSRDDERRMKKNGHLARHCLVCHLRSAVSALDDLPGRHGLSLATRRTLSTAPGLNSPEPNGPVPKARMAGS